MQKRNLYKLMSIILMVSMSYNTVLAATFQEVKVYDTDKLNSDILTNRVENNEITIERCKGIVINDNKDGEIVNPFCEGYDYISYKSVDDACQGDTIITYFVYNPHTDVEDDIILRLDFIL